MKWQFKFSVTCTFALEFPSWLSEFNLFSPNLWFSFHVSSNCSGPLELRTIWGSKGVIVKFILMQLVLFSSPLFFSNCTLSAVLLLSVVGLCSHYILKFPSPQTDKLSPVSLTPASIQTALMGKNRRVFILPFCLFFLVQVPPKWQHRAQRRLGGRWCHLLISWRPIRQQKDHVTGFASTYPPIYRHCSQPYQTNGDVKRTMNKQENRSDFLRLETERFRCSESSRTDHFLLMCGTEMIQITFCPCEIQ